MSRTAQVRIVVLVRKQQQYIRLFHFIFSFDEILLFYGNCNHCRLIAYPPSTDNCKIILQYKGENINLQRKQKDKKIIQEDLSQRRRAAKNAKYGIKDLQISYLKISSYP